MIFQNIYKFKNLLKLNFKKNSYVQGNGILNLQNQNSTYRFITIKR